ncbi:MAG: hypothetical protein KGL59_01560 [Acidobacteriota bacterium]|nr:hypothetical protein [Acidobacteriota bacterium]
MAGRLAWLLCAAVVFCPALRAQQAQQAKTRVSPIVVFWEEGFPAADTAAVSRSALEAALPQARFTATSELPAALARPETRLLVLPYGSAFPEEDWDAISGYLRRDGNLLVLGGKPFTRPADREDGKWKLQPERMAYAQRLLVNRYEETPGSRGLTFERNEDFSFLHLPSFGWSRSFSLVARLSGEDLYPRGGSAGGIDAQFSTLVWGAAGDRRLSAPLVEIDHFKNDFIGGRWIILACDPDPGFLDSTAGQELTRTLAARAAEGAELFLVQPEWALFLEGEPWVIRMRWDRFEAAPEPVRLEIEIRANGKTERRSLDLEPHEFPYTKEFILPPHAGPGLRVVTARLEAGGRVLAIYHTGFWLRDTSYLDSGPRVTINHDFFEIDGHPTPVVGSTYMASDVQREFFMSPNPYVWDQDMGQMQGAGINMLRTGWWTAWDQVMKESGVVHEEMLRTLEAFLMTARKHDLPVQFNFFAFLPDPLGGGNPYLNPDAVRRQKQLVLTVVRQFRDVPYLMWDLINEPSFSNPRELWMTRPDGGPAEVAAWNRWLAKRYSSREALAAAWNQPLRREDQPAPLPRDLQFSPDAARATGRFLNSIEVHDYYLFSQEEFRDWAQQLRQAIRETGSRQLVTVGQDEGGGIDRPSPAWHASAIDFTTTHSWWLHDALLWDSLVAKVPGEPMLVQETGIQRAVGIDGSPRRSQAQAAALLNRKLTMALATGAGAIQWLWNTNAYMDDDNEVAIGALRVDGTEKPQELVLSRLAQFARVSASYFEDPEKPPVAIVTSQAFQYSALNPLAVEAQQEAVRALEYSCRVESRVVSENRIDQLGHPQLAILPSPMALGDAAWKGLLEYVKAGGNLLITGSVERDEEWHVTNRMAALGLDARPVPLLFHQAQITLGSRTIPISFGAQSQAVLDVLRTEDGKPFHEIRLGKGRLFILDYPVELAEGSAAAVGVYQWVLEQIGVRPRFTGQFPSTGVLIRPEIFSRAVLYLFDSESDSAQPIDIRDNATGAEIKFVLPAQASRLILLSKPDGKVIARYGF